MKNGQAHTNGQSTCGARTRKGTPCKRAPSDNGRCHLHGGKSLKGTRHPSYKHGLYSKYVGKELQAVLSELDCQPSEELINPDNEIKLMQALIISAKALKGRLDELKDLDTISKIIDRLITAKQRSQAIMIEQQRLVPVTDIERFLEWLETLLIRELGDQQSHQIFKQLKSFKLEDHAT